MDLIIAKAGVWTIAIGQTLKLIAHPAYSPHKKPMADAAA
jgi:hypothetical protein